MCVYADVCLDVNQGGTNRNRRTQTCILACTELLMDLDRVLKTGHFDLFYGSKSPTEKSGREPTFSSQLSLTAHGMLVFNSQDR